MLKHISKFAIYALFVVMLMSFTACPAPSPTPTEAEIRPAPIHEIQVMFRESYPVQVSVYIKGGLADSCTAFHDLKTTRNNRAITIEVTTERPKDAICAQVYSYFEKNVNIGSDFVSGETYTVNVNDKTTTFKMPTPASSFSQYQLEYQLLEKYPDVFWCDPDFYPVAREGQEELNAQDQFPTIQANADEFVAILQKLGMPQKSDYTDEEKLLIYREYKKLAYAAQMTPAPDGYSFSLRVGEGQGQRLEGIITFAGNITINKTETSFNTCPICLARGTLIDTRDGAVPVELLRPGMSVWTLDAFGQRTAAQIVKASSTPVPPDFQMVRITLSDGRSLSASPGHPTIDNRILADYRPGDRLDGATVISAEQTDCDGGATFDILPAGPTGIYWADGIPLRSTLW